MKFVNLANALGVSIFDIFPDYPYQGKYGKIKLSDIEDTIADYIKPEDRKQMHEDLEKRENGIYIVATKKATQIYDDVMSGKTEKNSVHWEKTLERW